MKKFVIGLLALLMCSCTFVGCANNNQGSGDKDPVEIERPDDGDNKPDEGKDPEDGEKPDEGKDPTDVEKPNPDEGKDPTDVETPKPDDGDKKPDEGKNPEGGVTPDGGKDPADVEKPDEGKDSADIETPKPDDGDKKPDEGKNPEDGETPKPDEADKETEKELIAFDKEEDKKTFDENDDWRKDEYMLNNLSADGYAKGKIGDFSQYAGTDAYKVVTTPEEFLKAIADAKYHYKNVWDDETKTYTQVAADNYTDDQIEGKVHVIEIANDLDMGYYKLTSQAKATGVISLAKNFEKVSTYFTMSDMAKENGISQIKVENTSNLLIYSKNGAKITHAGFKLTSDYNVVFRNIEMDELWQWEDASVASTSKVGDYDGFDWAYFKIAFSEAVWIDHCTFGKSFDGQIDYSNPVYDYDAGTAFRAPYGATGDNGVHISWCKFNAGSDDKDGYLYKMMEKIEQEYKEGKTNYLYYNALRNGGASFEDILYGLAIPQKKGFLCGDSGDKYEFNLKLKISFANCTFKNLEDRIPKLRGGNAYMYNCIVDNSQYYEYRTKLRALNAASLVSKVSSSWKCALTSQGIVCGNGGSVIAENCIFKGIESLLKNNDSAKGGSVDGGYKIVNCAYQRAKTEDYIIGSSDDGVAFTNSSTSILKAENFKWNTADGKAPFKVYTVSLKILDKVLECGYGSGVTKVLQNDLLKSNYNNN